MTHSVYVISSAAGNFAAVVDVPNTCSANDDWTLNSKINLQIMIESGIWGSARHLSLCGIFRESALDQSWRDGHRRSEIYGAQPLFRRWLRIVPQSESRHDLLACDNAHKNENELVKSNQLSA